MKKIFVSTLTGIFLFVNVSSVAANTINYGNDGGVLQNEDIMQGYQKPPSQMPKGAPELIAWLASILLEKGIEWVRKKEDPKKTANACSCYQDMEGEGHNIKGHQDRKYFGSSVSIADYDGEEDYDDDDIDLTGEEISALDDFCNAP